MHTLNDIKDAFDASIQQDVESLPLFHVVNYPQDTPPEEVASKVCEKLLAILTNGYIDDNCNTAACIDENLNACYFFLSHLYPQEQGFHAIFCLGLNHLTATVKASPFDTGGVLCCKSDLGKHVNKHHKKFGTKQEYVARHTTTGKDESVRYSICYIAQFFNNSVKNYVGSMEKDGYRPEEIDKMKLLPSTEIRNFSFEFRVLGRVHIPQIENESTKVLLISKQLENDSELMELLSKYPYLPSSGVQDAAYAIAKKSFI